MSVCVHQYEQKKEYKEQLRARDKAIEEERRRIAQVKLKKFDEEAIRRRMQYKGIPVTSSSGLMPALLAHTSQVHGWVSERPHMFRSSYVSHFIINFHIKDISESFYTMCKLYLFFRLRYADTLELSVC